MGYSPWGRKESDMTERLRHNTQIAISKPHSKQYQIQEQKSSYVCGLHSFRHFIVKVAGIGEVFLFFPFIFISWRLITIL